MFELPKNRCIEENKTNSSYVMKTTRSLPQCSDAPVNSLRVLHMCQPISPPGDLIRDLLWFGPILQMRKQR